MWLAGKAQRPWVVGCGVLMVAEEQGTGRGTLINMVTAVFGARNVKPVTSIELMGGSGQGQYNAWQADSVLVTCDEVMAGDDGGGSMTWKRREAYEKLRAIPELMGIKAYCCVYRWFTEISGLGLSEQARRLMHPDPPKKEEYLA